MLCFTIPYEKSGRHGYRGVQITAGLEEYISKRVSDRYRDVRGAQEIAERFSALPHTDFESMVEMLLLRREFSDPGIAETLAECFLEDYGRAKFPYVSARDSKNPKSSQAGADLVGFSYMNESVCFLFGEVKFSRESDRPPTVVVKEQGGLMVQLRRLDSEETKDDLIVWLAQKMRGGDMDDYRRALESYHNDPTNTRIVGVLARTTSADNRDLLAPFEQLTKDTRSQYLEMVAIYVGQDGLAPGGGVGK